MTGLVGSPTLSRVTELRIGRTLADSTPSWPERPALPASPRNILVVLLDDVGFSDFGCYGSEIDTPTIDAIADSGVRFTGFHTTAMCSTTRASLLTGRNHHSVGMGCLANFDSGFPGYRGKIASDAVTIAEILGRAGYRNYMIGKWHATRLTESGPTGPFDGWPLGRGFHRFYGFLDAETDQYSPELVRDNSHVSAPGNYDTGYHLTEDLVDNTLKYLAEHQAVLPDTPWLAWFAPGACHAPHQAPKVLIDKYADRFSVGWDHTRSVRLARQIELGVVPPDTELPPRNHRVQPWNEHTPDEQRVFARLQGAYAAMLEHTDTQLGRVIEFLASTGQLDDTMIFVMSDNGASQEGGPLGFVNAMGPFNLQHESMETKIARIDDIGGPDTHSNFPWGWAMTANTPLKRYKQNTHGGGIRDPLIISGVEAAVAGSMRHNFCHVADFLPTVLDLVGLDSPAELEGVSFARQLTDTENGSSEKENLREQKRTQYFEMFGHRGLWQEGWKAVAYHQPGTSFDDDEWELYHLETDFAENRDLASKEPARLTQMIETWWSEAERYQVLPLDDRFAERFAENANRHLGERTRFEFWVGMGHLPSDVAPDLRSRSYQIEATIVIPDEGAEGVLIAHGDATSGYSLFIEDGYLKHDLNIGGTHQVVVSDRKVPPGRRRVGFELQRETEPPHHGVGTLSIDGEAVGSFTTERYFWLMVSWSGLDIGHDRGTPVSHYQAPFTFAGDLINVIVTLDADQRLDHEGQSQVEIARD